MRYPRSVLSSLVVFLALISFVPFAIAQEVSFEDVIVKDKPPTRQPVSVKIMIECSPNFANLMKQLCPVSDVVKIANQAGYNAECLPGTYLREGRFITQLSVLQMDNTHVKETPEAILKKMCDHLQRFLNTVAGPRQEEIEQRKAAVKRVRENEREVSDLREYLTELKRHMLRQGGGNSLERLGHQRRELQSQKMMLEVELAGLRARREAIVDHIALRDKRMAEEDRDLRRKLEEIKLKKLETQLAHYEQQRQLFENRFKSGTITFTNSDFGRARLKVAELKVDVEGQKEVIRYLMEKTKAQSNKQRKQPDAALDYLEASLKVHKQEYRRMLEANKRVPGTIPLGEVERARLEMQKAHCEIEAHRQKKEQTPRNELLAGLTHQLTDIEIETATIEAKLAAIDKMLDKINLTKLQQIAEEIEMFQDRLEEALDRRAAARAQLAKLERQQEGLRPPKVTILDDASMKKLSSNKKPAKNK